MHTVTLAMLGQGQLFGDIDFVFQRCYTYQLRVIENDSQVYLVKSKDFEKVIKTHKETWRMVEKSAIERNQALLEKFSQQFMMKWRQSEQSKKIVH
jgi:signal-transduction protein with cAMP-binding, CBS, and nucleotidyltransferase domain